MRICSIFFAKKCLKIIKKIAIFIAVPLSPLIVWFVLTLNRELIEYIARSTWLASHFPTYANIVRKDVSSQNFIHAFNSAALSGLLTLFGVIVTVWYYYTTRQQDLTERKFFVIDELIAELKKNRREINYLKKKLNQPFDLNQNDQDIKIHTEVWHKLGADVALLPRRLHMRLSVLYGCLAECKKPQDYCNKKVTIDKISDLITDLHKYRSELGKKEVF